VIWLYWVTKDPAGKESVLVNGPIAASPDEKTPAHISIELPHPYGGTIKTGLIVQPGMVETLRFSYMPDPPEDAGEG
jgi:hypothetical protein